MVLVDDLDRVLHERKLLRGTVVVVVAVKKVMIRNCISFGKLLSKKYPGSAASAAALSLLTKDCDSCMVPAAAAAA